MLRCHGICIEMSGISYCVEALTAKFSRDVQCIVTVGRLTEPLIWIKQSLSRMYMLCWVCSAHNFFFVWSDVQFIEEVYQTNKLCYGIAHMARTNSGSRLFLHRMDLTASKWFGNNLPQAQSPSMSAFIQNQALTVSPIDKFGAKLAARCAWQWLSLSLLNETLDYWQKSFQTLAMIYANCKFALSSDLTGLKIVHNHSLHKRTQRDTFIRTYMNCKLLLLYHKRSYIPASLDSKKNI